MQYKLFILFYRSYEVDETFPNTVVVTIDATHHMRMPPGLLRHMHNHLQAHHLPFQNPTEQSKNYNLLCYLII